MNRLQHWLHVVLLALMVGGCNGMSAKMLFQSADYVEAARLAETGNVAGLQRLVTAGLELNRLHSVPNSAMVDGSPHRIALIHWAVAEGNRKAVQALLEAGADPDVTEASGRTPLLYATQMEDEELFRLLVERGADPNLVIPFARKTALSVALSARRFDRAEWLLAHGAKIEAVLDDVNTTPLLRHAYLDEWPAVRWLLEHDADFNARSGGHLSVMCRLRSSFKVNALDHSSDNFAARAKVKEFLLARGVARSRVDPALHPSSLCDD